ncbi:MAG TPA: aldo/keto reductase, partial [Opitutaceae bacterium]|nr:aldo/keto reductase [Opitutaceae bacterium]
KFILATKVGRYGSDFADFDFSAKRVTASVDESLRRMGVEYVDIIQCHDIEFEDLDLVINETLPALREVVRKGKARFVGITGLPLKVFRYVLERTEVDTILSYCHYALNDTSLRELLPLLKAKNIGIINASPYSMGLLTEQGPPVWHPAPKTVKDACKKVAELCKAQGANISQVALHFALSNPDLHTTLVGTAKAENIQKNVEWMSAPVDQKLLAQVQAILAPIHDVTWPSGHPKNN